MPGLTQLTRIRYAAPSAANCRVSATMLPLVTVCAIRVFVVDPAMPAVDPTSTTHPAVHGLLGVGGPHVAADDGRALGGEQQRGRAPLPAGRPGDQGDLAGQPAAHLTAIGLTGEPTAPVMASGAAVSQQS